MRQALARAPLSALLAVLAVTSLAGCTDQDPEPMPADPVMPESGDAAPPEEPGQEPLEPEGNITQIAWELIQCRFAYVQAPAIAEVVAADLPDGFALSQPVGNRVVVGIEINVCQSGTGINGSISPQTYASFWVAVTPPDGMGEQGALHFVNFDVLVQDEPRRTLLQSWGVPAHDGHIDFTDLPDGSWTADYTIDDVGSFSIAAAAGRDLPGPGGAFDQWTPGSQGLTYWRTDFVVHDQKQGLGTVTIDPASRYAQWFEAPTATGLINHGTWDYVDGYIQRL